MPGGSQLTATCCVSEGEWGRLREEDVQSLVCTRGDLEAAGRQKVWPFSEFRSFPTKVFFRHVVTGFEWWCCHDENMREVRGSVDNIGPKLVSVCSKHAADPKKKKSSSTIILTSQVFVSSSSFIELKLKSRGDVLHNQLLYLSIYPGCST